MSRSMPALKKTETEILLYAVKRAFHDTEVILVDIVFLIILQLLHLALYDTAGKNGAIKFNKYKLPVANDINTAEGLVSFMSEKQESISAVERNGR